MKGWYKVPKKLAYCLLTDKAIWPLVTKRSKKIYTTGYRLKYIHPAG
jgi:hypothetical protein